MATVWTTPAPHTLNGHAAHASPRPGGAALPGAPARPGVWSRSPAWWLAAFYVALFIIRPWEQLLPGLAAYRVELAYALLMVGVVAVCGVRLRLDVQTGAVLLYLAALGVSGVDAWRPELAVDPIYAYGTLVVFYVVLTSVIRSVYELVSMIAVYIVVMGAYLAKSLWEFAVNGQYNYDQGVVRLTGIENSFGMPNSLAMSIVVSLPMLLFLAKTRQDFTRNWPRAWQRLFSAGLAAYLAMALVALVLTNSRSGLLSLAALVGVVTLRGADLGRRLAGVAGGLVLLAVLWQVAPQKTQDRLRTIWDPTSGPAAAAESAQGRIDGFYAGWAMFVDRPVAGVGPGNFLGYRVQFLDHVPLKAHNLLGQLLGEVGLLGTASFFVLVGAAWANAATLRRRAVTRRGPMRRLTGELGFALAAAILLLAFEGLFGHNAERFNWLWLAAFGVRAVDLSADQPSGDKR